MRSDRYKKSDLQSTMNHEDRHDFWAGNPQGEHTDAPTKAQSAGGFMKSLLIDIIIALILLVAGTWMMTLMDDFFKMIFDRIANL